MAAEGKKLDFSKIRKNSRDYSAMSDEERAAWNDYQKEKQREYRKRRKAEREQLEELAAGGSAPVMPDEKPEPDKVKTVTGTRLYLCSDCGEPLTGCEDTCPKCGVLCDWRGTDTETGSDYVVCGLCGFAESVKEFTGKCKRCGWDGK